MIARILHWLGQTVSRTLSGGLAATEAKNWPHITCIMTTLLKVQSQTPVLGISFSGVKR